MKWKNLLHRYKTTLLQAGFILLSLVSEGSIGLDSSDQELYKGSLFLSSYGDTLTFSSVCEHGNVCVIRSLLQFIFPNSHLMINSGFFDGHIEGVFQMITLLKLNGEIQLRDLKLVYSDSSIVTEFEKLNIHLDDYQGKIDV